MNILMDKIVIEGGHALHGDVTISGSKNAVLPMMAAALLADGNYTIDHVPDLRDVKTMGKLLDSIGSSCTLDQNRLTIQTQPCQHCEAPYDLVKTMRASIYVLGPLLARYGHCKVSLPGGCAWGPRPVNLHLEGLKKLGAKIEFDQGYILAKASRLKGAHITFDISSVGATGNLLMAAVLAKGTTILENAAREPEIEYLCHFLNKMGARIEGIGTDHLTIEGADSLHPANDSVIPDRIEAGTFLVAAHMTGGSVMLTHVVPEHISAVIQKLRDSGAEIEESESAILIKSNGKPKPVDVTTAVYPGFPTDMQAQWMALMSAAKGSSVIMENIYLDRFTHLAELKRLGADITLDHNVAIVKGVKKLSGAHVMSTDLRASASLILAGLIAEGETHVSRVYHIDRGYESIETKFRALGANIRREHEKLIV